MSSPTPVTDRLQRLAEHAPARGIDPDVVWTHGRRRQRARWAGTAACLVLLAVLGAVAVPPALHRSPGLVATSPDTGLRLPDVIRQPGEWEGAEFPSAPGPLVAVGVGHRDSWLGGRATLWGVSGVTGESRFLELPSAASAVTASAPALSPDGLWLAYWVAGETTEDPLANDPATGVAVLNLRTGELDRWDVDTPHGLQTRGLAWAGRVLWWSAGDYRSLGDDAWSADVHPHRWDLDRDERTVIDGGTWRAASSLEPTGGWPPGFLVPTGVRGLRIVRGETSLGTLEPDVRLRSFAGRGDAIAGIEDLGVQHSDAKGRLLVDERVQQVEGGSTAVQLRPVGDVHAHAVLGWRSDTDVVVASYASGREDAEIFTVDIETGEVVHLVTGHTGDLSRTSFAADAWSAHVIEAPDAPWAPDPRVVGLGLLVLGTFLVSLVNSVRRRRGHP